MEFYSRTSMEVSIFNPLPRRIRRIATRPWMTLWKTDHPNNYRMILVTFSLLIVLLLLPGLLFGPLYDYEVFRQYAKIIELHK